MTTVEDEGPAGEPAHTERSAIGVVFGLDRLTLAVAGITALALLARFFALGQRIAHWDEARVAWWILHYADTGTYSYDAIIHGPFYHHVNRQLFALFGETDATLRLSVAAISGLAPLAALGLRHRLRNLEVAGLALFVAFNPLLLYYSRFMRGDPIVAYFMFVAFVLFVRLLDFGRKRALLAGVGCVALALTAKENAILYPVTWLGAGALLLDHRLLRAGDRGEDLRTVAWQSTKRAVYTVWHWLPWLLLAVLEFVAIVVFFYAPRSGDPGEVGLDNAIGDPSMLPDVLEAGTVGAWKEFYGLWVSGGHQDHAYLPYLGDLLLTMAAGALVVSVLAAMGFLVDRYAPEGPRELVAFGFYWGVASLLGYPIVTDIKAPWVGIHAVLGLAIPAAAGLAVLVDWGRDAVTEDDTVALSVVAVFLVVSAGIFGGAGLWGVYVAPQSDDNELIQYAQPGDNARPALDLMATAAADNEGTDVALYGDFFVDGDEDDEHAPACSKWFNALPLPWYFETADAEVACAEERAELADLAENPPPVLITDADNEETVRRYVPSYWSATYELRTHGTETVFFVHPEYAQPVYGANATDAADGAEQPA